MAYEIAVKHNGFLGTDALGENEPRSLDECREAVAAFQAGECGDEFAEAFDPSLEGREWTIREV